MQSWRCSNKQCRWNCTSSLSNQLKGRIHDELIKLQAENGANQSYRKASAHLQALTGKGRKINNRNRIRRTTNEVGKLLEQKADQKQTMPRLTHKSKDEAYASELNVVVDGGHVHDAHNRGHNFEAMIAKVFRPENVVWVDKHHNQIVKRHCAGSAKSDKQKTMKKRLFEAVHKEGINKGKTVVTALADGAKNCWNIIKSLEGLCLSMVLILDWFHIGKYIKRIKLSLPNYVEELDKISQLLWYGKANEAKQQINKLVKNTTEASKIDKLNNFYDYIHDNQRYIVNYHERKQLSLPYSSHVAESTVEHLLNERCKRKQKMQWSRDGLHTVIQIRVSQASGDWDGDWKNIIKPQRCLAA